MNPTETHAHGQSLPLAQSELGHVSLCSCGVVTVTLHYMSLRFEPAAFRELLGMLSTAQRHLEGGTAIEAAAQPPARRDGPPVH
jgi:hypothetical protein